jgi:hypothetical protein
MRKILTIAAALALIAGPVVAGEWHAGANNVCTDCHTMHFSMQHGFDGGTVSTTPAPNGNWLGTTGPNMYLLKLPANELCLACHDGQTFAPDVLGDASYPAASQGRMAGALNDDLLGAPYEDWKGHTLDSTNAPPGYNPAAVGWTGTYTPANGLECINCHLQHGSATVYRNLGPRQTGNQWQPTYVIGANDTTKDIWVNVAAPYTPNSGDPAVFGPYYDYQNVNYNRAIPPIAAGTTRSSNRIDTFCGTCHGNFHGSPTDSSVGGQANGAGWEEFIRHPTSDVTIGLLGGGHSSLSRYVQATTKVKTFVNDRVGYTDASPGCVSCHKAHGNQNPFGLFFLNRNATAVTEQGGYAAGQVEMPNGYGVAYRNLCGQCHSQGN